MRYFQPLRRSVVATVAVAAVVVALALPAGATAPTGNAAAIRLYTAATIKMNKLSFLTTEVKSLYFLKYLSNGSWELYWGVPKPPAGYSRVTATEITASSHNKNVWEQYTFAYACPSNSACISTLTPVRFYITKTSSYWAELNGSNNSPGCWVNSTHTETWIRTDFGSYGLPNWYPGTSTKFASASFFSPAVTKGTTRTFTSTFTYDSDKAKVTEVDTENDTTTLFTHSSLKVGTGKESGKRIAGYSYSLVLTVPKGTVHPPKTTHQCG